MLVAVAFEGFHWKFATPESFVIANLGPVDGGGAGWTQV